MSRQWKKYPIPLKDVGKRKQPLAQYKKALRKDPCAYCGASSAYSIDHIHPRSRGGDNKFTNLAGSCPDCNSRKGSNSMLVFMLSRL